MNREGVIVFLDMYEKVHCLMNQRKQRLNQFQDMSQNPLNEGKPEYL